MFKRHLDGKLCARCGRYFQWRKRWARNWESVRYCSRRCAGQGPEAVNTQARSKNAERNAGN